MIASKMRINFIRGSNGFDRDDEAGEASRKKWRETSKLKLNAEDNLAYAA